MKPRVSVDQGFGIYESVLEQQECWDLLSALANVPRTRAGIRHVLGNPAVLALAHDVRLTELARCFLGAAPFPYRATLFDKSAGSNWLVVWHQDTALPFKSRFTAEGWGPWSVKDGVLYAHSPASALSRLVALCALFLALIVLVCLPMRRSQQPSTPQKSSSASFRLGAFWQCGLCCFIRRRKPRSPPLVASSISSTLTHPLWALVVNLPSPNAAPQRIGFRGCGGA
jgi:hypothetical protein